MASILGLFYRFFHTSTVANGQFTYFVTFIWYLWLEKVRLHMPVSGAHARVNMIHCAHIEIHYCLPSLILVQKWAILCLSHPKPLLLALMAMRTKRTWGCVRPKTWQSWLLSRHPRPDQHKNRLLCCKECPNCWNR